MSQVVTDLKKKHERAQAFLTLIDSDLNTPDQRDTFIKGYVDLMASMAKPFVHKALGIEDASAAVSDVRVNANGEMHVVQLAEQAYA